MVFPDCIFWKLDVKDFYLMGTADELGFLVIPDGPEFEYLRIALAFLLQHQYVISEWVDGAYTAITGTGRGLCHSGDVADLALFD